MATMADGRPTYLVRDKLYCLQRSRRPDAIDPDTGERLADVLMFRVAPNLARLDREELRDLVVEAWLTRAPKRVARAWLAEHGPADDPA